MESIHSIPMPTQTPIASSLFNVPNLPLQRLQTHLSEARDSKKSTKSGETWWNTTPVLLSCALVSNIGSLGHTPEKRWLLLVNQASFFRGVTVHPQGFGSNDGPCGHTEPSTDGKTPKPQLQIQIGASGRLQWSWFHELGMVNSHLFWRKFLR